MPLFLFRDGVFYEQEYAIDETGEVTIEDLDPMDTDSISPTEMARRKYEIPGKQRISVRNRALNALAPKEA